VQFGEGTEAWLPTRFLKALRPGDGPDAYERLRASPLPNPVAGDPLPALEELARAIGPLSHVSSTAIGAFSSNARPAAGLFGARDAGNVIDWLVALHGRAIEARVTFTERLPLPPRGDELAPTEWARFGWAHRVRDTFAGAFEGLLLCLHHRSADARRPPGQLVGEAHVARLARCSAAARVVEALRSGAVLAKPAWHQEGSGDAARALGLPNGAMLFSGSGFLGRGVTFFDPAEAYGPFTNEELVGEALAPTANPAPLAARTA
jgi:hypothetical protein